MQQRVASAHLHKDIVKGKRNIVFHSEWDNFNQKICGVTGTPMLNAAGGIGLQEVSDDVDDAPEEDSNNNEPGPSDSELHVAGEEELPEFFISK